MKKVYLSMLAFSFVGASFAQVSVFTKSNTAKAMPRMESAANKGGKFANNGVAKASIFAEDFENWPLNGWTISGGPTSTTTNASQKWHEEGNGNPGKSAGILYVNSVDQHDEELTTPVISIPAGQYYLSFDFSTSIYWHAQTLGGDYNNADIYVVASTDGGANWSPKLWQEDNISLLEASFCEDWETYTYKKAYVNVSAYAGQDVQFKFVYKGKDAAQFMLDNVAVDEIPDYEVLGKKYFTGTDSEEGVEYFNVPVSQANFPGIWFSGAAQNIGKVALTDVVLTATGTDYTATSASKALGIAAIDTFEVTDLYALPTTVGTYSVELATVINDGVEVDLTNSSNVYEFNRTQYIYGRDNEIMTGSIGQVSSQDGMELMIGNVMQIFDDMTVTAAQVALTNQPAAVGQVFNVVLEGLNEDGTDFIYLMETETVTVTSSMLNSLVTLKFMEPVNVPAGTTVLVMAHHFGGADEIQFGMAQGTVQGSVLGRTADGNLFNLTDPSAIMVRLSDDPTLSVSTIGELEGVKVYPNPTTGLVNVSNDLMTENTITVTDLTGKVVLSKVVSVATSIELGSNGAGVYFVEVANANGKKVEKVIVK